MLARRELPDQYAQWNRAWAAPYGRPEWAVAPLRLLVSNQLDNSYL
jgi:hypothetical protein